MGVFDLMNFICYTITILTFGIQIGRFSARKNRPKSDQD